VIVGVHSSSYDKMQVAGSSSRPGLARISSSSRRITSHGASRARTVAVAARRGRGDRRKPPPPDLPSLLFDQRIVYLGMPVGFFVFAIQERR
jgi:hypothetical protein